MHVAIAGNIGAGKTTLTRLLAKHYKWNPHFESVDENPYLDDFYSEMERWSFNKMGTKMGAKSLWTRIFEKTKKTAKPL